MFRGKKPECLLLPRGPFLERPGNLTGPKSVSRKVGCVVISNEVHLVSLADNLTLHFSNLLKLSSGMENKTWRFEKRARGGVNFCTSLIPDGFSSLQPPWNVLTFMSNLCCGRHPGVHQGGIPMRSFPRLWQVSCIKMKFIRFQYAKIYYAENKRKKKKKQLLFWYIASV